MNITVLLADDHRMLRAGLRKLLEAQPGVQIVGEADDGRMAVDLSEKLLPDMVVMDIAMPDLDGIEATRQITGRANHTKVIALSGHSDQRFVSEMFAAGASAYVLKESAFEELALAVRTVAGGKTYVSPAVTGGLVENYVRGGRAAAGGSSAFSSLTAREREVLQLIAEGKATKQAAACLHVSVKTVETHRRSIMQKLDMNSVAELTKYAIREGLTTVDG
jgi:two-component system, NarL family, response regulator NreC